MNRGNHLPLPCACGLAAQAGEARRRGFGDGERWLIRVRRGRSREDDVVNPDGEGVGVGTSGIGNEANNRFAICAAGKRSEGGRDMLPAIGADQGNPACHILPRIVEDEFQVGSEASGQLMVRYMEPLFGFPEAS